MNRTRVLSVSVAIIVIGFGCSSKGMQATDARVEEPSRPPDAGLDLGVDVGVDVVSDAGPGNMTACRVRLDDPLSLCAPTPAEQATRYQGTDFGMQFVCAGGTSVFGSFVENVHTWQCLYDPPGVLVAWDRIENGQQYCEGRASAVVADLYSRYVLINCLAVDNSEWTWIQSFDPGPTTISIQLGGDTVVATRSFPVGLGWVLGGREIAAADLSFRYWYTADARGGASPLQTAACDSANGLVCDYLTVSLVPVTTPRPMADTYAEVTFPNFPGIISTGFFYSLGFFITRADGALYDQSNDYSYPGATQLALTTKVTAYVKGTLIYGTEP